MAETIAINSISRIEGHAKITIQLDESGAVSDARMHVTQLRGFEKFCEGRPFSEMPSLMARICGICPVSHLIASAKACDAILATRIPETAANLRRVLNLAQLIQSHALSFFHLSSPDFLLGMDSDPAKRNIFGVLEKNRQLAKDGIRLRQFGQQVIERMAGKRIHPAWVVPGGVSEPLSAANRDVILAEIPEALEIACRTLDWFKTAINSFREEIRTFGNFPTLFVGLVNGNNTLEHYHGVIRIVGSQGNVVGDRLDPTEYAAHFAEATEPSSYLKSPYLKSLGYPEGIYRVGPLARLNTCDGCGTKLADQEWAEFRELERGAVLSSFYYHYARLVEVIYALEKMEQLLSRPDITAHNVRAKADANCAEGIGVIEAPRGVLIHHYQIDCQGLITRANLIVATGHNSLAMNKAILQTAKHFVHRSKLTEGALNRVEAVIRAFDPCLSCSTHALGRMAMAVELVSSDGEVVDCVSRI